MAQPIEATATPPQPAERPMLRLVEGFADPDLAYSDAQLRERGDEAGPDWLIDGLLPYGAFLLIADPGAGKSIFVQQVLHHLAYGRPLGPWEAQGGGGRRGLVVDLEGDWLLNRDRSYTITPYGQLATDGHLEQAGHQLVYRHDVIPPAEAESWRMYRKKPARHLAYLDALLSDQAAAGAPLDIVVIDTLTKFLGPRPADANAYEHEAGTVGELNRLGLKHHAAIVVIHHTNKAGEVSGSTGILGSATVGAKLELSPREDNAARGEAVLRSLKVRSGAPFAYPLAQLEDGTWSFVDDVTTDQAVTGGQKRDVLDALAQHGPMSKMELLEVVGMPQSLPRVLRRLKAAGMVRLSFGRWCAVEVGAARPGTPAETVTPPPAAVKETATRPAPDEALTVVDHDVDQDDAAERSAYTMLRESIAASRMHPVFQVPEHQREDEPWTLITERMDGRHRWAANAVLPADQLVAVLDRNGSFPSAAGSVPLVANLLHRSGPLDDLPEKTGGLFLIDAIGWEDERIGNPLGVLADQAAGRWWITTPHLLILRRLAKSGVIPDPVIRDSWTGRATGGLLTTFSKEVQQQRLTLTGDAYTEAKTRVSKAMRALWPKHQRSPFWRPDWSVTLRAEASVRHWATAYRAVLAGAQLLSMSSTDEVVFKAPADSDASWAPEPYSVDDRRYGAVKHKAVNLGAIEAASPLQYGLWAGAAQSRREARRGNR